MTSQYQHVLVTGATGFIGAQVVDELLCRGIKVRGTTRSANKAQRMRQDRPHHLDRLEFVITGALTDPGVFDEAVKGVDGIVHIASPIAFTGKDNENELLRPAIQGTQSLLAAAQTEPTIRRIVLLSSIAAILDPSKGARAGYTYIAADWNPITYDEAAASPSGTIGYMASKTLAEASAWAFVHPGEEDSHPHSHLRAPTQPQPQPLSRAQAPPNKFDLVTLCPPLVFGPGTYPMSTLAEMNISNGFLWSVARGLDPPPEGAAVPFWVDVRDLARAHVEALVRPEAGNRRWIVSAPDRFSYAQVKEILREEFDWAEEGVVEGGEGQPRAEARAEIPDSFDVDGATAGKELGLQYRSFRECVVDVIKQFKALEAKENQA